MQSLFQSSRVLTCHFSIEQMLHQKKTNTTNLSHTPRNFLLPFYTSLLTARVIRKHLDQAGLAALESKDLAVLLSLQEYACFFATLLHKHTLVEVFSTYDLACSIGHLPCNSILDQQTVERSDSSDQEEGIALGFAI